MVNTRAGNQNRVEGHTASITGDNVVNVNNRSAAGPANQTINQEVPDNAALLRQINELRANVARLEREAEDRSYSRSRGSTRRSGSQRDSESASDTEITRDRRERRGRDRREGCTYKTFLACQPPKFEGGTSGPIEAIRWVREMERAFEASKCLDEDRVIYGTRLLKKSALDWWDTRCEIMGARRVRRLEWDDFVDMFRADFCTEYDLDKLEDEFTELKMGKMSVDEYAKSFVEKLKFVPHVVSSERAKVKKFVKGLPAGYRTDIRECKTLTEAIEKAKYMEGDLRAKKEEKEAELRESQKTVERSGEKRKFEGSSGASKKFRKDDGLKKSYMSGKTSAGSSASVMKSSKKCMTCGSTHAGECSSATRRCFKCAQLGHMASECTEKGTVCFNCHEPGHFSRDCPKKESGGGGKKNEGGSGSKKVEQPKARSRAYQMIAEEDRAASDGTDGMFLENLIN